MKMLGNLLAQARLILSFVAEAARIEREIESASDPADRARRTANAVKRWQARVDAQVARDPKERETFEFPRPKVLQFGR